MSLYHHSLMVRNLPEPSDLSNVVALRVIRYASHFKYPNELDLYCPDCRGYPKRPVTGYCGHTRCTICIEKQEHCPCGAPAPLYPHVDVLVQELLTIMFPDTRDTCVKSLGTSSEESTSSSGCKILTKRLRYKTNSIGQPQRQPITSQRRYEVVRELIRSGCYKEAVPHLAIFAATKRATLRSTYVRLLAQVIEAISGNTDPRVLVPELIRSVRREGSVSAGAAQLRLFHLECTICCNILKSPVTTPCGHTFCKFCIKRMIVNAGRCALCCHPIKDPFLDYTAENHFINVILASLPAPVSSVEDDFIPVFNCTVAFPSVPCPLMIIDPRACHVVRRILDMGSRNFGMVGCDLKKISDEYGTVLEVKDCVQLKNGCFILSTIGVSRFKILERICIDGVMMARVERHIDVLNPDEMGELNIRRLKQIKSTLTIGLMLLLYNLGPEVRAEITAALGPITLGMDTYNTMQRWWENPDGANWLWWLAAILPLKHTVQVNLLSKNLKERLTVVAKSLQSMVDMSETEFSAMVSGKIQIKEL